MPISPLSQTTSNQKNVTWTKDVQPIIEKHCVRCHSSEGQGTGDFTDFDTVHNMAPAILNSIDNGTMPPPAADPDCHPYVDSDKMYLPDEHRNTIDTWINNNRPYGDEKDEQIYDRSQLTLENPDMKLMLQEPYTPTFSDEQNPMNEYRCFVLEHGMSDPFYITAMHPIIDQSELIHHIVLAKGGINNVIDGAFDPNGVNCIGDFLPVSGDYSEVGILGAWAPGMSPVHYGENAGVLVQPNDFIAIQIHYYQSDSVPENTADQSGYAFQITTERPDDVVQMAPLGLFDFYIPAGAEAHTESTSFQLPIDIKIWGVFPHMHILGSGYEMSAGDQCLLKSNNYDFDNQLTYMYPEPIDIPANEELTFSCTWNNSTSNPDLIHNPPVPTYYGERTDEEMCFAFSLISF